MNIAFVLWYSQYKLIDAYCRRLNAELEKKTANLVKEAEAVIVGNNRCIFLATQPNNQLSITLNFVFIIYFLVLTSSFVLVTHLRDTA